VCASGVSDALDTMPRLRVLLEMTQLRSVQ
jgi:hypothetical protein